MIFNYFNGFLSVIGGICLFIWGTSLFSKGITEIFDAKKFFTAKKLNKYGYYGIGVLTTALIQSSDATTLLAMRLAQNKSIDRSDAVSITFGARLGTTVTALLASAGELDVSPIVLAVVTALSLILPEKYSRLKKTLLGVGLFFGGLMILDFGSVQIQDLVRKLFADNGNHFLLFLMGLGITAVLQSSSAITSALAVMTNVGATSVETAVFLLIGATVGTTATPLIAGIKTDKNSKYVALSHIAFSFLSAIIVLPVVDAFSSQITAVLLKIPKAFSLAVFGCCYGLISSFACLLCQKPLEKCFLYVYRSVVKIKNSTLLPRLRRRQR